MTTETAIRITATHIAYLTICHRKLWLFANGLEMEHSSELVLEGRLIHETVYPRRPSKYVEIQLDGIKIDFYDPHTHIVHETKKGRVLEAAHRAQVQYYLYKLGQHGVSDASGLIEYPDLRKTEPVAPLTEKEDAMIQGWETDVQRIVGLEVCPGVIDKPFCKRCSYHDFCYSSE